MRFRLLALDLDGTLTDPEGRVRDVVRDRVREAEAGGVLVVLCTGRRYRTTVPVIEALGLGGPVVVHNGVVVKDAASGRTLERSCIEGDEFAEALAILKTLQPPIVYVDRPLDQAEMYSEPVDRASPDQARYIERNAEHTRWVERLEAEPIEAVVVMSSMAERDQLLPLRASIERALPGRAQTNLLMNKSGKGHILEVVPHATGKWTALSKLALHEGIEPSEIIAIGDDANDVELLAQAGLGIAMGNAIDAAKAAADHVTASNADDGAARAIERFLLS
jgi:Cof subfamily protein (haloacid dehalogenase superfamily)